MKRDELDSTDGRDDETASGYVPTRNEVDARAASWLDSAGFESAGLDTDANSGAPAPLVTGAWLGEDGKRRLVDLQFLHVLLDEMHRGTAEINSDRVRRAMAAIHEEPSFIADAAVAAAVTPEIDDALVRPAAAVVPDTTVFPDTRSVASPRWGRSLAAPRTWLIPAAAVAAAIAGFALWLTPAGPSQTVFAAVQRVTSDARSLRDRQYRILQSLNFAGGEQRQIESLLYVRGGEKFAISHPGVLGTSWMGSNGREGWLIPAIGPPLITDNPSYPARWAEEEGLALPDLQLTGLLELMQQRFQLTLLASEPLPGRPDLFCQHISGWCDARDGGAQRIQLWAHPETGVAQRLVLEWDRAAGETGLTRIQLDLLSEIPQADAWYEADAHRHPRPILGKIPIFPSAP
ncbi:MAG: hypothetical protein JNG90_08510 [Planctomycetaceae bacterium]|nr:hypothetical protein [Planctomycetaceae bacterium]